MSNGRNKFLVILVVILLITNLGMLWYFTAANNTGDKEDKMSRNDRQVAFMKKELNLDSAQAEEYRLLRIRRDSVMRPLNDSLREAKLKMMSYLKQDSVSDSLMSAITTEIAARQKPIEMEYYHHFQRVRSLCRPEQKEKYDSMLVRFVNRNTGKDDKKDSKKD